jgi:hypothetical protein
LFRFTRTIPGSNIVYFLDVFVMICCQPHFLLYSLTQDVIEELICSEIVDETDIYVDNERLTRVNQAS